MASAFWKFKPHRLAGMAVLVAALVAPPTIALGQDDAALEGQVATSEAAWTAPAADSSPPADDAAPPQGGPGDGPAPPSSPDDGASSPPVDQEPPPVSQNPPPVSQDPTPESGPDAEPTGGNPSGDPSGNPATFSLGNLSLLGGEDPEPTTAPDSSTGAISLTLQDADGVAQDAQTVTSFVYDALTDLHASPKLLWITAEFPAGSTDRHVSIDFNNLLMPASGVGLRPNGFGALGAPWTTDFAFDPDLLPTQAQGIVTDVSYTPALDDGEQIGGGNLTYSFADSADDMTVVVVAFLTVNPTYAWKLDAGPLTRGLVEGDLAPVVATVSFDQPGGGSQSATSNIENVTITDGSGAGLALATEWDATVRHPGDSGTFDVSVQAALGSDADHTFGARLHSLHWRLAVAKRLGVQSVSTTAGGTFSFTIDRVSSPTLDYIDITGAGQIALASDSVFSFTYTIAPDAVPGTVQLAHAIDDAAPASLSMVDDLIATATDLRPLSWDNPTMTITADDGGALRANALTDIGFPQDPPAQILLAGIGLSEINAFDIANATFALDFNQVPGMIGVETIRIGRAAYPAHLANIVITTTKGKTITVSQKNYSGGPAIFAKTDFSGADALAADEYFAAITFDYVGRFPANWSANNPNAFTFFISAFGKYFGSPVNTPNAYKLALNLAWDGDNLTDPTAAAWTWNIGHHASGIVNAALSQIGSLSDIVMAGAQATVALQTTVPAAIQSSNNQIFWRGVTWYLRKGNLLTYDRSSFNVTAPDITSPTFASRTFTEANGGLIVEYVEHDAVGQPFWKITAPNAFLMQFGGGVTGAAPSTAPTLNFTVRVNTAVRTEDHNYADYFFAIPTDSTNGVWSGTGDSYNLTGLNQPSLLLATPSGSFGTIRNAIIVIDTAAQSQASPEWLSYSFATGSDEAVLGTSETSLNRQVAYYNGSGGDPDWITIMMPVPKQGQSVPGRMPDDAAAFDSAAHLQAEPFGFTENLTAPVQVPAEAASLFTVTYATSYLTDRNSPTWQDWSAISDPSAIKMVKIEGANIPGSLAEATFTLNLTVPGSAEALRAQAGAANTFAAWHDSRYAATTHIGPTGATSVRLGTGQVHGTVFLDAAADGVRDGSDGALADVVVQAVRPGTDDLLATTTTVADGSYTISGLTTSGVDIVFINPDVTKYHFTSTGPGLDSQAVPVIDHSTARAAAVDAGTGDGDGVDAGLVGLSHVTFAPGAGSGVADLEVFPGTRLSEPSTARLGYTLTGWFADVGLTIPWDFATDVVGGDLTLWAAWAVKTGFAVTYDLNYPGAPANPPALTDLAWTDTNLAPSSPTRTGYEFAGWWTVAAKTGGVQITAGMTYGDQVASDTTMNLPLFARWAAKTGFTITYDLNHPTGDPDPAGKTGLSWTSIDLIPHFTSAPEGWSFAGWFTAAVGGTAVNGLTPYGDIASSDDPAVAVVLYAHWTDVVMPTATVSYRGAAATSLQNRLTYGLFFTAGLPVTIHGASDRAAVTKVEYLITTETFVSPATALAWGSQRVDGWTTTVGTSATFTIPASQTGRMVIFTRVTNSAGNTGVYFDSVTLYTNAEQKGQNTIFIRGTAADVTVNVTLNGNTVAQIVNTDDSAGGTVGISNYQVDPTGGTGGGIGGIGIGGGTGPGGITIKNAYLASLTAGTYTFMVSYNPAGLRYLPDNLSDSRNQAPLSTTFTIEVLKQSQSDLSITGLDPSLAYTYGDPAVGVGVRGGSGTGLIDWTALVGVGSGAAITPGNSASGDAALTLGKPGKITLRATKLSDDTYDQVSTLPLTLTIAKAIPPVSLNIAGTGAYGQPITLTATVAKVGGGLTPIGSVNFLIDSKPVAANPVSLNSTGTASYTVPGSANLALGNHVFEVRYSGDTNYKGWDSTATASTDPSAYATRTFSVGKTSQTITVRAPGNKTWGYPAFSLALATSGSGSGLVTWTASPSGILSISGTVASIVGTGTVTITATKAADTIYNSATASTVITVAKALPVWSAAVSGTPLSYGQTLSASKLPGSIVRGVGSHAADVVSGTVSWNAPALVPDVTGLPGTPDFYAITFTPTGADANRYLSLTGSALLTVNKITPTVTARPTGTPILPAPHDTLAESTITGGAISFHNGNRITVIPGHWTWDVPETAWPDTDAGIKSAPATFTPNDIDRFGSVSVIIEVQVCLPKTVIITGPVASAIYYGDRIQNSELDAFFASVEADNGEGSVPITGTWTWTEPETRVSASGSFTAEVTFTPNELAPEPLEVGVGYVITTMDLTIPVLKAIPHLERVEPGDVANGQKLSAAGLEDFNVVGVFGETIPGTLRWTYPDVIPSTVLDGTGLYPAVATFTPAGAFAEAYEVTEFPVFVRVVARVDGIEQLDADTIRPIMAGLHTDNYSAEAIQAVNDALAEVDQIRVDPAATQAQIDAATRKLREAFWALTHFHPVLTHSHPSGLIQASDAVTIQLKGDIRDITSLLFNGVSYGLRLTGDGFSITNGLKEIGTIVGPQVTVSLNSDLLSSLRNGTYELVVVFADNHGGAEAVAQVTIARTTGAGLPPDAGSGDVSKGGPPSSRPGRSGYTIVLAVTGPDTALPTRTAIYLVILGLVLIGSATLYRTRPGRGGHHHRRGR